MTDEDKIIRLEGMQISFRKSELRVISEFFKCTSGQDLLKAATRYETLFSLCCEEAADCEPHPHDIECNLELALALSTIVFKEFRNLEGPLTVRHQKKPLGRRLNNDLPSNICELIKEAQKHAGSKEKAIRYLISTNKIKTKSTAQAVLRRVQQMERELRKTEESFQRFVLEASNQPQSCD